MPCCRCFRYQIHCPSQAQFQISPRARSNSFLPSQNSGNAPPHLVYHVVLVEHVWIEESVPEPDVAVHLPPLGRHPGEHGPDERVAEAEGSRGKLVEDGRVAGGVVLCVVALCVDTQVVEVHVVPADDAREELVEGDVLGDARHDATAFLVQGLVGPVRVDALNIDDRLFFTIEVSFKFKSVP
jgi:hypothetical protein